MQTLAHRLAIERRRLGWTQNELADRLEVTRSIIALMEGAHSPIYVERLLALEAQGFDVPFVLWGMRSKVWAGELLDWALLAEIKGGIRDWCDSRDVQLMPEKEAALEKLLYKYFVTQGQVSKEGLEDALAVVTCSPSSGSAGNKNGD